MGKKKKSISYDFFKCDPKQVLSTLGKKRMEELLAQMVLIRHFETRAESAYQHGLIGGFFHAYMGQEAIQTAAVEAIGRDNWWTTTYRCHALALLMGATPNEVMAELYGRETGNAKGRGGSMHLYADRMLGGFGIVGGHLPVATGSAFSLKYQKQKGIAICFLGDGAVAQGAVHESLNLASLWDLPIIYVVENNLWGMGTAVNRAIAVAPIGEHLAHAYGMKNYTFDGMDFCSCYAGFKAAHEEVIKTKRPIVVEAITERFRGHSISDPALYRSKAELEKAKTKDPIPHLTHQMEDAKMMTEAQFEKISKKQKDIVLESMKFADESPWPDPITLEEGVFAP